MVLVNAFTHILLLKSHHHLLALSPNIPRHVDSRSQTNGVKPDASSNIAIVLNPENFTANRILNRNITLNFYSRLGDGTCVRQKKEVLVAVTQPPKSR
jgi:hypothetical protein